MNKKKKEWCSSHGKKIKALLEFLTHVYDFALHFESHLGRGVRAKVSPVLGPPKVFTQFSLDKFQKTRLKILDVKCQVPVPNFQPQALNNFLLKPNQTNKTKTKIRNHTTIFFCLFLEGVCMVVIVGRLL